MSEQHTDLVRGAVEEVWNGGDLAQADVLFAPTYVNHGGLIPDLVRGPEAIKSALALYRAAFPDFYITIEALTGGDEFVELSWAAHRGGTSDAGNTLRGLTRSRCASAQIVESWTTWDRTGVLTRLGLVVDEEERRTPDPGL